MNAIFNVIFSKRDKNALYCLMLLLASAHLASPAMALERKILDGDIEKAKELLKKILSEIELGDSIITIGKNTNRNNSTHVIIIGDNSTVKGNYSTVIGHNASAISDTQGGGNGVAIGTMSEARGDNVTAIGSYAKALDHSAVAIGSTSLASGNGSVAIGVHAKATQTYANAFGEEAKALGDTSTALGYKAGGLGDYAMALGAASLASKENAITLGYQSMALAKNAMALGYDATSSAANSIALGAKSFASQDNAIALGYQSMALGKNAVALGQDSMSVAENSVALGAGSIAMKEKGREGFDISGKANKTGNAWISTAGAVSIGSYAMTRQLTGLAAGTDDTDAVNVAQLRQVTLHVLGNGQGDSFVNLWKGKIDFVDGNATTATVTQKDHNVEVKFDVQTVGLAIDDKGGIIKPNDTEKNKLVNAGDLHTTLSEMGFTVKLGNGQDTGERINAGEEVVFTAGNNIEINRTNGNFTIGTAKNVKFDTVITRDTQGNTTMQSGNGITISKPLNPDGSQNGNVSLTVNGLDNGGNKITHVAKGEISENSTDAVNGSQLHQVQQQITNGGISFAGDNGNKFDTKLGETVTVTGGATGNLSDGKNIGVTANNGSLNVQLSKDLDDLNSAKFGKDDQITIDGKNTTITAGKGDNKVEVNGQKGTVTAGTGNNQVTVNGQNATITAGSGNHKVEINGANSSITVAGDHSITVDGNKGQIGGLTNTTYDPNTKYEGGFAATQEQLQDAMNKMEGNIQNAVGNASIKVSANGGKKEDIKLNDGLNFQNGTNTTVTVSPKGDIQVDVNSKLDGIESIGNGKDGAQITLNKNDKNISVNGGKITDVADGEISETSKDAVNGSQLHQTNVQVQQNTDKINQGIGFGGNTGESHQSLGSTVKVVGSDKQEGQSYTSGNITTSYEKDEQGNGTITVEMKEKPTFKGVELTDEKGETKVSMTVSSTPKQEGEEFATPSISLAGTDGEKTGIPVRIENVAAGVKDTDAVNVSQLKGIAQHVDNHIGQVNNRITDVDKHARAGIASAGAMATLPHEFRAGRSQMAVAATYYRGESALAVGFSRVSDNSKWTVRVTGSTNSQKDTMIGAGAGYSW